VLADLDSHYDKSSRSVVSKLIYLDGVLALNILAALESFHVL
jgi:hypothetical protein